MIKVIIAGSRDFSDYSLLKCYSDAMLSRVSQEAQVEIVSGCARGADSLGIRYAEEKGYRLKEFPANWSQGRGAGYRRNEKMGEYADVLIAFWDGKSRETRHMIEYMQKLGKPVRIKYF